MNSTRLIDKVFSSDQILVVLDTMIVRELGESEDSELFDFLVKVKASGIQLLISEVAIAEMTEQCQRSRGGISDEVKARIVGRAKILFDQSFPICPISSDIQILSGIQEIEEDRGLIEILGYWQSVWKTFCSEDWTKVQTASPVLEEIREDFRARIRTVREVIQRLKEQGTSQIDYEKLRDSLKRDVAEGLKISGDQMGMFENHISLWLYYANLLWRDQYNEESVRRRNDGIDVNLMSASKLYAYLITESKWMNIIKSWSVAPWCERVLDLESFGKAYEEGLLSPIEI